jgi:acyl-CoA synthetase (AMP-forming)/AMP-acid ligase II
MALPPFHSFGIVTQLYLPIAYLVTSVVYPPRTQNDPLTLPVIPTSDNVIEQLKKIECNVFMTVPTFLEQMATSDELIEVLKKIDNIVRAIYCDLPSLRLSIPGLWRWPSPCQDRSEVVGCWGTDHQWLWRDRIRNPRGIG